MACLRPAFFAVICLILNISSAYAAGGGHGEGHGEGHGGGLLHASPWLYFANAVLAALVLIVLAALASRKLTKVPGKLQNFMEMVLDGLSSFFLSVLGPGGEKYVPFLSTMFLYIMFMNLLGLTGVILPPTSTLNMTIALALVSFFYIQFQAIKVNGLGGYLMHFIGKPIWLGPLMLILHIIGELAKPLSLSFRLFGNIFGEETVIVEIAKLGPAIDGFKFIPIQAPLLVFGVLKSVIQALVFTVLSAAYLVMMTSHDEEHGEDHHHLEQRSDHDSTGHHGSPTAPEAVQS